MVLLVWVQKIFKVLQVWQKYVQHKYIILIRCCEICFPNDSQRSCLLDFFCHWQLTFWQTSEFILHVGCQFSWHYTSIEEHWIWKSSETLKTWRWLWIVSRWYFVNMLEMFRVLYAVMSPEVVSFVCFCWWESFLLRFSVSLVHVGYLICRCHKRWRWVGMRSFLWTHDVSSTDVFLLLTVGPPLIYLRGQTSPNLNEKLRMLLVITELFEDVLPKLTFMIWGGVLMNMEIRD